MSYVVVIPSRNAKNLKRCIGALRAAREDGPVLVVWDGPKMPTKEELDPSRLPPNVFVFPGVEPFCFARNCNIGIRECQGKDVVLLNDDVLLETPRGLEELGMQWTDYAVISPLVRGPAMAVHQFTGRLANEILNVTWVPFCCVYLRAAALAKIGPLDERFQPGSWEDNDWCRRARAAGYLVGVYRGVVVDHATLPHTFREAGVCPNSYDLLRNRARYIEKWRDREG